jgi:hypothetical protein
VTSAASEVKRADAALIKRRWWLEITYIVVFYILYSAVRNQFGSGGNFSVGAGRAIENAETIIDIEEALGLFFEEAVQRAVVSWEWYLRFWNIFYGSLHFVVTIFAMVHLYLRFPNRYRTYRNIILSTTALALIGFVTFPLMPPRLLNAGGEYGASLDQYEFIDSLSVAGGLWSFDTSTMEALSNQWAAMPSLHIGWAMWCTVALFSVLQSRWTRAAVVAYPLLTLYAIVVTANHYWIDAVGGAVILWAGWHIGMWLSALVSAQPADETTVTNYQNNDRQTADPDGEPAH